jgi:hypothetical protein
MLIIVQSVLHPQRRAVQSFFMSEGYRAELLAQSHLLTTRLQPEGENDNNSYLPLL